MSLYVVFHHELDVLFDCYLLLIDWNKLTDIRTSTKRQKQFRISLLLQHFQMAWITFSFFSFFLQSMPFIDEWQKLPHEGQVHVLPAILYSQGFISRDDVCTTLDGNTKGVWGLSRAEDVIRGVMQLLSTLYKAFSLFLLLHAHLRNQI